MSVPKQPDTTILHEDDPPPMIETIEGVGAHYLYWTRNTILSLRQRVDDLEHRLEVRGGPMRTERPSYK